MENQTMTWPMLKLDEFSGAREISENISSGQYFSQEIIYSEHLYSETYLIRKLLNPKKFRQKRISFLFYVSWLIGGQASSSGPTGMARIYPQAYNFKKRIR